MSDLIWLAAGLVVGAGGVGGWWYWLGHRHGLRQAAAGVQAAVTQAAAAVAADVKGAAGKG